MPLDDVPEVVVPEVPPVDPAPALPVPTTPLLRVAPFSCHVQVAPCGDDQQSCTVKDVPAGTCLLKRIRGGPDWPAMSTSSWRRPPDAVVDEPEVDDDVAEVDEPGAVADWVGPAAPEDAFGTWPPRPRN